VTWDRIDLCARCREATVAKLSDPDTGERLCYECFIEGEE
jgi:formylmethanofuran dehydrogenase subunit E